MRECALSVRQPWAGAIFSIGKDIENRTWSTDYRGRLWIHASRLADRSRPDLMHAVLDQGPLVSGAFLGYVDLVDVVCNSCSPWAIPGQLHWVLANPVPLAAPVPAKGQLRLWVPPELQALKR